MIHSALYPYLEENCLANHNTIFSFLACVKINTAFRNNASKNHIYSAMVKITNSLPPYNIGFKYTPIQKTGPVVKILITSVCAQKLRSNFIMVQKNLQRREFRR